MVGEGRMVAISQTQTGTLTHLMAQYPGLWPGVNLHEDGGRADEEHQQVGNAQIGEKDVCGVAHILRLHNHDGHLRKDSISISVISANSPASPSVLLLKWQLLSGFLNSGFYFKFVLLFLNFSGEYNNVDLKEDYSSRSLSLIRSGVSYSDAISWTYHYITHHSQQHYYYAEEHGGCADIRRNLWQHLLSIIGIVLGSRCFCCSSRCGDNFCGDCGERCGGCCGGEVAVGWNTMSWVVWAIAATRSATG